MGKRRQYYDTVEDSSLATKNHLDRVIICYEDRGGGEVSMKKFEEYLLGREAILDVENKYAAIGERSQWDTVRRRANGFNLSVCQVIPLQTPGEKEELKQKMLPLTESTFFQANDEGWLYIFYDNNAICLYIGITEDSFPLRRATSHLKLFESGSTKWAKYLWKHRQNFQGWYVKFIRPGDCEHLIQKSFFLPNEDSETIMSNLEDALQEKRHLDPVWWLKRAEWVLITVLKPKCNEEKTEKPYLRKQKNLLT